MALKDQVKYVLNKDYQREVGIGVEYIIRSVLVLTSINAIFTPMVFRYLDQHNFTPNWLSEFWGLMLAVFIISTVFWVGRVLLEAGRLLWVVPLALICSLLSLFIVVKQVPCTFNRNVPRLTRTETRFARG